jgi:hypothetical protein
MINAKLFSLLTQQELEQYVQNLRNVIDCETILRKCDLNQTLAKSIFAQRVDSMLLCKNLEFDCSQRIQSILDLCHGTV